MNVRDAMTPRPVVTSPEGSIAEAYALMRRGRFRHLPVVSDGVLAGVVSERDLRAVDSLGASPEHGNRLVRAVMSSDPITISPDDPVEQAARLMLENKVGCLPVIEDGHLAGIITEADIFRAFVQVLGVLEPGTRVHIRATDLADALERVAAIARRRGIRIVSIVSERPALDVPTALVVRFGTLMLAPLLSDLREAGLEIAGPDAGLTGGSR